MKSDKLVFLSLGVLTVVGILLTGVLVQRARNFERQAARIEAEVEPKPPLVVKEPSPSATFRIPEATPSSEETTPSASF